MRKTRSRSLTSDQRQELKALAARPEQETDLSEMPEIADWSGARRGTLYRPVKRQITLRLDADIVEWFRSHARREGYQTNINKALRLYIEQRR